MLYRHGLKGNHTPTGNLTLSYYLSPLREWSAYGMDGSHLS